MYLTIHKHLNSVNLNIIMSIRILQESIDPKNTRPPQFHLNIPTVIVQTMKWMRGERLRIEILGKDKLKIEKVKQPSRGNDRGDI